MHSSARVLGLGEAAQPREHERRAEHRSAGEQRVVVRGARVRDAVLQRGQRTRAGRSAPTAARASAVVARAYAEWSSLACGDRHRPFGALRRLLHAPLHPVRLRQLDQRLGRELGRVGLHLVDQRLERTAVAHDVEHLVGADRAADAPEVQLDAGLGVGVVAQQLERGLEVADGLRQLQVAPPAQPGPTVELGLLLRGLRDV